MIDCPICHIMNEDTARFCAECGQRLLPNKASQTPESPSIQPVKSPAPGGAPRLRSPLLSGSNEPDEPTKPSADFSNLRNIANQTSSPQKGLRSPLLDRAQPPSPPSAPSKPAAPGSPLRSPLLGGGQPDIKEASLSQSDRQHLHSPLLEGTAAGFEPAQSYAQPDYSDDPNVLRSPLLEVKLPMPEHPTELQNYPEPPRTAASNTLRGSAPDVTSSGTIPPLDLEPSYISPPTKSDTTTKGIQVSSISKEPISKQPEYSGVSQMRTHSKLFDEEKIEPPLTRIKAQKSSSATEFPLCKLFLAILAPIALFELWMISQNLNQLIVAIDHLIQFLVVTCLIYICACLGRSGQQR